MLDFMTVVTRHPSKGQTEVAPKFIIKSKSSDLMIRGGDFYAVWNENTKLWSTDEGVALNLIDAEVDKYVEKHKEALGEDFRVMHMWDADSGMIDKWHKYVQKQLRDSYHALDEKLIFSNTETTKEDYASRKLPYPLEESEIPAFDELMNTLYLPEERHKIEWAVGSIITGDSKKIQKFLVLYGSAGTGKSTVLNIIQDLFEGYYCVFDAKALGSANNSFALEAFKTNPLVAIQHDGDLSRIEDNTRLNSLVSHELMTVNEKFKSTYSNRFISFLFMGTNKPVRITDAKSGIIRRLIDVSPTGKKVPASRYKTLMSQIRFELGSIATHCKEVYLADPSFYDSYIPTTMLGATNDTYDFILYKYESFKEEDGVSLERAWKAYKEYMAEANPYAQPVRRIFQEELKNYFREFHERTSDATGVRVRNYYSGFITDKFISEKPDDLKDETPAVSWLKLEATKSLYSEMVADCPAQYATSKEAPAKAWDNVTTTMKDISDTKLHYVRPPENHIFIDFDIRDSSGQKSYELNAKAASEWKTTYAELSKGGQGIHLHYIYDGDVNRLSSIYAPGIEVKVIKGKAALRRRLSKCNDIPVAHISTGLPLKEEAKMVTFSGLKNERALRTVIMRAMLKEYHAGTKPAVDFIFKVLEDAYASGLKYDVSDMHSDIFDFAMSSTNHSKYCMAKVGEMKFKSEVISENTETDTDKIVIYDVEVFSNLFIVVFKQLGPDAPIVKLINPTPADIENLVKFKLVGFNCRRYDNHILYARLMGYSNEELYELSQRIINKEPGCFFGEAYNLSYTDIYDFSSEKKSLKKFEIDLGIHHQELGLKWYEPVPEEKWQLVADYCVNDVIATEAVWNDRAGDFTARKILADLAGMTVNDTTNSLTTRIIFGKERHPQLVYTDLATGNQE